MQDLQQHQTTKSGRIVDGNDLGNAPATVQPSRSLVTVGQRFGRLVVIDATPVYKGKTKKRPHVFMRCTTCGVEGLWNLGNARRGLAGCRKCGRAETPGRELLQVPKWLYCRSQAAQDRCINPNNSQYRRYGGRGIEFRFESPREMAAWVQKNLGLHREMQIDRIDNNGHYEPGNLRYATQEINVANSTKSKVSAKFHAFRIEYPNVRYADRTLRRLLLEGMTFEQIRDRFYQESCKPKGVYGTFSTPDPAIASRLKDS